jgi:hypothetical protein
MAVTVMFIPGGIACAGEEASVAKKDEDKIMDRRGLLQCMAWVAPEPCGRCPAACESGHTAHWVGRRRGIARAAGGGLQFVQISDSHIGFDKPARRRHRDAARAAARSRPHPSSRPSCCTPVTSRICRSRRSSTRSSRSYRAVDAGPYVPGEHDVLEDGATATCSDWARTGCWLAELPTRMACTLSAS